MIFVIQLARQLSFIDVDAMQIRRHNNPPPNLPQPTSKDATPRSLKPNFDFEFNSILVDVMHCYVRIY